MGSPSRQHRRHPTFTFAGVEVLPGTNTFIARQEIFGTITDSAPIIVELDPTLVPDLEAVALAVAPEAVAAGER